MQKNKRARNELGIVADFIFVPAGLAFQSSRSIFMLRHGQ